MKFSDIMPLVRLSASAVVLAVALSFLLTPAAVSAQASCSGAPGWVCFADSASPQYDKRCGSGPCEECFGFVNKSCTVGEHTAEDYWPAA